MTPQVRRYVVLAVGAALSGATVLAQPVLPPEAVQQFQDVVGNRMIWGQNMGGWAAGVDMRLKF